MAQFKPDTSNEIDATNEANKARSSKVKKASLPGVTRYKSLKEAFRDIMTKTESHHRSAVESLKASHKGLLKR